jgi:DNA polymerase elongation subunit (family B)
MELAGRIINGWCELEDNKVSVVFMIRSKTGKKEKISRISNIRPYFYVKTEETGRFLKLINERKYAVRKINDNFVKIEVNTPGNIYEIKNMLESKWTDILYEGDISFVRRYMIDNELYGVCEGVKLRKAFFDIECDDSKGFPRAETERIVSIAIIDSEGKEYFYDNENEEALIREFIAELNKYDIISGWNIFEFDLPYLMKRCQLLNIEFRTEYFQFVDLLILYKDKLRIKILPAYTLETVAQAELGR